MIFLIRSIWDVVKIFNGQYPGFRASNTKYHDLEHTNLVVLAVTRLMHGCFLKGHAFSSENLILGFAAALFHDVGLIQAESEQNGSGAVFTLGHEERSIAVMGRYLAQKNFSPQTIADCAALIQCTILSVQPKDIPFRNKEIEMLGNGGSLARAQDHFSDHALALGVHRRQDLLAAGVGGSAHLR